MNIILWKKKVIHIFHQEVIWLLRSLGRVLVSKCNYSFCLSLVSDHLETSSQKGNRVALSVPEADLCIYPCRDFFVCLFRWENLLFPPSLPDPRWPHLLTTDPRYRGKTGLLRRGGSDVLTTWKLRSERIKEGTQALVLQGRKRHCLPYRCLWLESCVDGICLRKHIFQECPGMGKQEAGGRLGASLPYWGFTTRREDVERGSVPFALQWLCPLAQPVPVDVLVTGHPY